METTMVYKGNRDDSRIMERNMETTIVYWGYIGIMNIRWKLLYHIGVILG